MNIGLVFTQLIIVLMVMIGAILAPPATGSILLLPLGNSSSGAMLHQAFASGARLEGAGPVAGSFIVRGDRARLSSAMRESHVLMIAASPILCGKKKTVQA